MIDNNTQYVNAMEFGRLMEIGGQSLVGVYAMLLKGRDGFHCYTPVKNSNNKVTKGKRLISNQSGVSLTALDRYLPEVVAAGLGSHMKNGGFILTGRQKLIDKNNGKRKYVPIKVGKNLRETKGNVNAQLIISNITRQAKQIDRKVTLNKAVCQERKGNHLSAAQISVLKNARKREVDLNDLKKVENTVLSNKRIADLITGHISDDDNNRVSKGSYWRKVLEERGFMVSRRRYKTIWDKKISYSEFLSMRDWFYQEHGFVSYKNGRIVKPIVSEVMIPNLYTSTYSSKYILSKYSNISAGEAPLLDIVS
jgi:hypothetical protein